MQTDHKSTSRSKTMNRVQQILVAIDMSAMATESLKRAIAIASDQNAQLIVIHVIEPLFMESPLAKSADEEAIRQTLVKLIDRFNAEANVEYMLFIESGKAAETIMLTVKKTQVDLIVVGSHGKDDVDSDHFGSTTLKLVQRTRLPVLIIKNRVNTAYRHMLAPTNLSAHSKESILFANSLFAETTRKYLYAYETISKAQAMSYHFSDEEAEMFRAQKRSIATMALETFVNEVGPGEMTLIDYSASVNEDLLDYIVNDNADLLVLGSKGVENLNSFVFGSTASYLVQRSPVDVLVYVPPKT